MRETQSFYAGFFIWPLSRAAPMARKFVSKSRPSRPASCFNTLNFLQIPQNFRVLPIRDVIRTLSPHFVSGYCDIYEWHVRPHAHQLHQGCTWLTHVLSRKVLSQTKPKGMNRKPSAIILYIKAYVDIFFNGKVFFQWTIQLLNYIGRISQTINSQWVWLLTIFLQRWSTWDRN